MRSFTKTVLFNLPVKLILFIALVSNWVAWVARMLYRTIISCIYPLIGPLRARDLSLPGVIEP